MNNTIQPGEVRLMTLEQLAALNVDYARDGGYQRDRSEKEIALIRARYGPLSERKWLPYVIVGRRADGDYCIDGNGRRLCAIAEGTPLWVVIVPGTTTREIERGLFCWINGGGKEVTKVELVRAHDGLIATAVREMHSTTLPQISWQKSGGLRGDDTLGHIKADLAASVIFTGATGEIASKVYPRVLEATEVKTKVQRTMGCCALLNVCEVFADQRIYREPALVVAEATFHRGGRRFTKDEIDALHSLPWLKQKDKGEARSNFNWDKLRRMVRNALDAKQHRTPPRRSA